MNKDRAQNTTFTHFTGRLFVTDRCSLVRKCFVVNQFETMRVLKIGKPL